MKQFFLAILSLALFVVALSGCGTSQVSTESQKPTNAVQSEGLKPPEPTQSNSADPVETNSLDLSDGPMFEFTQTTFVEVFDDVFQEMSDFDIPNAFANEPSVMESLGCVVYTYEVDICTECVIYFHPETNNVIRIIIRGLSEQMTEENKVAFWAYATCITDVFASEEELEDMREALAIETTPYTQNTINFYNGNDAKFSYTITDGLLMVRISPAS